jgi:hypothetical protein
MKLAWALIVLGCAISLATAACDRSRSGNDAGIRTKTGANVSPSPTKILSWSTISSGATPATNTGAGEGMADADVPSE